MIAGFSYQQYMLNNQVKLKENCPKNELMESNKMKMKRSL